MTVRHPLRSRIDVAALAGALWLASSLLPASAAHMPNCDGRKGIDLARCERHQKMAGKCGELTGEAHYACDREFLMANPLECKALEGEERKQCAAETEAFRTCSPKAGSHFIRCVRDEAKASPMGH
jgi:hypothetical protein